MLHLYQALKSFPPFSRQLVCRGMLFTNYDCPQDVRKAQVFIEQGFILYVIRGKRVYHQQKFSWELKEGSCAFIKKGGYIAEKPEGAEWCVMAFFVPDEYLIQLLRENKTSLPSNAEIWRDHSVMMMDVNELTQSCFFSMLPYFSQNPPPPESLVELKFKELILSLLANPANKSLLAYINNADKSNSLIRQVMENNFSFRLSLSDYAKMSCKSISTFKREFKKQYNDSPGKWLMRKRLDLARNLLSTTALPVNEICIECGFENVSHFSRVFKEKTGLTPLQFRDSRKTTV